MTMKTSERGQALILITLTAIVLFGFAALAVDGTMAFSDKRHAQNAADTSVLAAALKKVRGGNWTATVDAARTRASSNGYNNNGTTNTVEVYLCSDANATCTALPTSAKPEEYIQVRITSHVKTYFARVIGRQEMTNWVEAVAHAVPGYRSTLFSGQAIVALNKDACKAFDYGGSGTTTVTGSGIFINSRCKDASNAALNNSANGIVLSVPCYSVVGDKTVRESPPTLITTGGCDSITNNSSAFIENPQLTYPDPNIKCDSTNLGTVTSSGGTTTIGPGYYDSRNSGSTFPSNSWQSNVVMQPGVYCLDLGSTTSFSLNGQSSLTGSNVLIYVKTGSIKWTSGTLNLSAITDPNYAYSGLLLVMAPTNNASVSIAGNQGSSFVGTILAPNSLVTISGGSASGTTLQNQIIADRINLTGGGVLNINYEASQQWQPPLPPSIEMNQ